ncbi:hypothetical protein LCGC14_0691440 [marine sediment metagenome]|uniref:Uncharacterized protein n=1 Tax=marine sediment metagenome TaxID=412755 RepID=A0A0F9T6J1_9ZZZZ
MNNGNKPKLFNDYPELRHEVETDPDKFLETTREMLSSERFQYGLQEMLDEVNGCDENTNKLAPLHKFTMKLKNVCFGIDKTSREQQKQAESAENVLSPEDTARLEALKAMPGYMNRLHPTHKAITKEIWHLTTGRE